MFTQEVKTLQKMPMLAEFDAAKLRLVVAAGNLVSYAEGDRILREGDEAQSVLIILDGEVSQQVGEDHRTIATFRPGAIVGLVGVILGGAYTASIVARTDVEALQFDRRVFLELLRRLPELSSAVMKELAGRLARSLDLLRESADPASKPSDSVKDR